MVIESLSLTVGTLTMVKTMAYFELSLDPQVLSGRGQTGVGSRITEYGLRNLGTDQTSEFTPQFHSFDLS